MTWLGRGTSLASCSLLLACNEPTAPQRAAAGVLGVSRAINPNAACFPVRFRSDDERFGADPTMIIGEFSGDIEGSFTAGVDLSTLKIAGTTVRFAGTATLTVTGGILPVPLPLTFTLALEQINQLRDTPVSPATTTEQIIRLNATSGVTRANLALHGTFDATTETVQHDWWGVICP